MKYLITGGAGFIGSNFIQYLLEKDEGDQIICLDKLTYAGNLDNLATVRSRQDFSFIKGDIADRKNVFHLIKQESIDVVVNFAAESHVDRSIKDPGIFLKTNVEGTQVLLDACLEYGVKRFHQVSTDEVYGDLPLNRPDLLFSEKNNLRASSPYSASKASADLFVCAYSRTYNLPATISRCSNNYGPYQFPEKLIPLMIIKAQRGERLPVYGKGLNVRDWLYVKDHCRAIDKIIQHGRLGEVYNVGGNTEKANLEIVRLILRQLGKSESLIEFVQDRAGHDLRYAIDSTKIRTELGWQPVVSFDKGIIETIQWYKTNEKWWKDILSGVYKEHK